MAADPTHVSGTAADVPRGQNDRPSRLEQGVRIAAGVGVVISIAGAIDGTVMAFHHHVGNGLAVLFVSALLGILVVLAAISAVAHVTHVAEK